MPRHQYKNKFNKKQDNVLLPEPNYPTVASSEHSNTDIVWENNIKTNFMKMILAFKEERSKSLKEIEKRQKVEEINKSLNKTNK